MATGTQYRDWVRFIFRGYPIPWQIEKIRDIGQWFGILNNSRLGNHPLLDTGPRSVHAAYEAIFDSLYFDTGSSTQDLTQSARFDNANALAYAHTISQAIELVQSATFTNANSLAFQHALALNLTPALFSNSNSLAFQHALALNLTPALFQNSNALAYAHTLSLNLVASLYSNSNSLAYTHVITQGQALTQTSRFDNSNALAYTHVVTPGPVTLVQSALYSDADSLAYGHTLALNLTAALFSNANGLAYGHTLTPGAVTLTAALYSNTNALAYGHAITVGPVTLTQSARYNNTNSLAYTHTLGQTLGLLPSLFSNANTFYTHLLFVPYPDPSVVLEGVAYGASGELVGTYQGVDSTPKVDITTGRVVKVVSNTKVVSL